MREMAFRRTGEREPVSGQERGVMNMLIDQRWTGIRSIAKWSSKNGREKKLSFTLTELMLNCVCLHGKKGKYERPK